jgi:hypothetical protein
MVKSCCGFLLILWLPLLTGCAMLEHKPVSVTPDRHAELPDTAGWWYARFRILEEKDRPPLWHIDALIAGEIIAPVFDHHFAEIRIWRVHRRAADDGFGHVFSFIFYATPQDASAIYGEIRSSPVLAQLQTQGLVTKTMFDNLMHNTRPDIEDTSDTHWPLVIQKTWPALIMGASRMWLDLVSTQAAAHADEPDLVQRYELVEQDIDRLWAHNGQHAVLHHINALFAYQPLLIRY